MARACTAVWWACAMAVGQGGVGQGMKRSSPAGGSTESFGSLL